jgi:hypothetical protein
MNLNLYYGKHFIVCLNERCHCFLVFHINSTIAEQWLVHTHIELMEVEFGIENRLYFLSQSLPIPFINSISAAAMHIAQDDVAGARRRTSILEALQSLMCACSFHHPFNDREQIRVREDEHHVEVPALPNAPLNDVVAIVRVLHEENRRREEIRVSEEIRVLREEICVLREENRSKEVNGLREENRVREAIRVLQGENRGLRDAIRVLQEEHSKEVNGLREAIRVLQKENRGLRGLREENRELREEHSKEVNGLREAIRVLQEENSKEVNGLREENRGLREAILRDEIRTELRAELRARNSRIRNAAALVHTFRSREEDE